MAKDLLSICKKLLDYLNDSDDLDENKKEYLLGVIRKMIFILLIEMKDKKKKKIA